SYASLGFERLRSFNARASIAASCATAPCGVRGYPVGTSPVVSVAAGSTTGAPVVEPAAEAAMGWGRAAAGATGNMGLAARAFFAASKAASADDEVDGDGDG